jgi:hypothetical protein
MASGVFQVPSPPWIDIPGPRRALAGKFVGDMQPHRMPARALP